MADASGRYAIRRVDVNPLSFTDLIPPIPANAIRIENPDAVNSLKVRTDRTNGTTEKTIAPQAYATFGAAWDPSVGHPVQPCFPANQPALAVMSTGGSGPAIVEFS